MVSDKRRPATAGAFFLAIFGGFPARFRPAGAIRLFRRFCRFAARILR
jgi:hypothetical protein